MPLGSSSSPSWLSPSSLCDDNGDSYKLHCEDDDPNCTTTPQYTTVITLNRYKDGDVDANDDGDGENDDDCDDSEGVDNTTGEDDDDDEMCI